MRIGSLCSGVGLLELGLEWAGLGETVWTCEINPFCRRILTKQYPHARHHADVTRVGAHNLSAADLICFGFPCQDLSSAGEQAGLTGARSGLFYECARVVEELRPEWVVVENVSSGAKLWVDACRGELERLGYASLPIPIEARDCGALHRRARIFIVAHLDGRGERAEPRLSKVARAPKASGARAAADAHAQRRQARVRKREPNARGRTEPDGGSRPSLAADADRLALWVDQQRDARRQERVRDTRNPVAGFPGWFGPEPDVVRVVHGGADGLDGAWYGAPGSAALLDAIEQLAVDRREALGNSVVPWCSEVVGYVIQQLRFEAEHAPSGG
jgi:DNA (cytosine-5)-methyltransferase 1